jgi:putative transcriptional regulator
MSDGHGPGNGLRMRLARQARGFSQQQLAAVARVSQQAISAVESGFSDPSLRAALALARSLGMTVEELFGSFSPDPQVVARPVVPVSGEGARLTLAPMGDGFVALPLSGATVSRAGFLPVGGVAAGAGGAHSELGAEMPVRLIGPPRPTLVAAGCDPALPLLERPLGLLDPRLAYRTARSGVTPGVVLFGEVACNVPPPARASFVTAESLSLPGGAVPVLDQGLRALDAAGVADCPGIAG